MINNDLITPVWGMVSGVVDTRDSLDLKCGPEVLAVVLTVLWYSMYLVL